MPPADVEFLKARSERLFSDRRQWETEWLDLADMCCPRKAGVLRGAAAGQKFTTGRYTGLGEESALLLASAIQGNLTNPSQRWLSFLMRQRELNAINQVQNWLDTGATLFSQALNASNFATEAGEFYLDLGIFGTAAMLMLKKKLAPPGEFPGFLFQTLQIGSYAIAENDEGVVDTLFREVKITVRAAYQWWGEGIGPEWMALAVGGPGKKAEPDRMVKVLHAIYPRKDRKSDRGDNRNMPWASVYFDPDRKRIISESGFRRFPALVTRWSKASGEVYGRGPGHTAIPELETLNRAIELEMAAWALDIAPPLFEREGAILGGLDWTPSARNIVRGDKNSVWTQTSGVRYDVSSIKKEEVKKAVEKAFFVDQVRALPPTDKPSYMTAFEVAKRYEETFRLLGSAFGQMKSGFLQPLVETGMGMLFDAQVVPIPPQEMQGGDVDIEYEGPLARAQKASDLQALDLETAWVLQTENIVPGLKDNYRWDEIAQHRARVRGIPASLMVGTDELARTRQAQAQQQAAQAQMAAISQAAQAAGQAAPMVKAIGAVQQSALRKDLTAVTPPVQLGAGA